MKQTSMHRAPQQIDTRISPLRSHDPGEARDSGDRVPADPSRVPSYVLITPARDEADHLEKTILSVTRQTVLPLKWVIVSDGSTDGTDELVAKYLPLHPWMELIRMPERRERHFAAKATCFHAGYRRVEDMDFDVVGNLDGDISFEPDFLEYLLSQFARDPSLGVAGTPFLEGDFQYDYRYVSPDHVSGQAQLFRRRCFEEIGGYVPIRGGGVDLVAVTTARMKGWTTRTFMERRFIHHRLMGTGSVSVLRARFRFGKQDYYLGVHPLWEVLRCCYQMKSRRPYVVGGLSVMSGYAWGFLNRLERPVSEEFVAFRRRDQMERLKKLAARAVGLGTKPAGREPAGAARTRDAVIPDTGRLQASAGKLERWVEEHGYEGYEPFDGLSSPLRATTFGRPFLERLLIQLVRQSPVNLRPLLGIAPHAAAKGRGFMAAGYLAFFRSSRREEYRRKAEESLRWLMEHKSPKDPEYCWGNEFDYTNRSGRQPKLEPTVVWSSLIGQVFLDGHEAFGERDYLDVADSICRWILKLPRERSDRGACLSYTGLGQTSIHNANMLGAAMLARTARATQNGGYLEVAKEAMRFSCARQLPDGAWPYGVTPHTRWIDNFHTGYNLQSLKSFIDSSGDATHSAALQRGYEYYKKTFFEEDGRPKYYHNRAYPIDIQCCSQAIDTLLDFVSVDGEALDLATRVAGWTIENMQDESGYFYYRCLPRMKVRIPMLHWGQATVYKALARLLEARPGELLWSDRQAAGF